MEEKLQQKEEIWNQHNKVIDNTYLATQLTQLTQRQKLSFSSCLAPLPPQTSVDRTHTPHRPESSHWSSVHGERGREPPSGSTLVDCP